MFKGVSTLVYGPFDMRVEMRHVPGSTVAEIYKTQCMCGFINLKKRMPVHISAFVRTQSFSCASTQSFTHLAPGVN